MQLFSKYQLEEIISLLEIRQDTIEDDPDSADEFEATPDALEDLKAKLKNGCTHFTEGETRWMIEEFSNRLSVAQAAIDDPEARMNAMAGVKSLHGAIDKLKNFEYEAT